MLLEDVPGVGKTMLAQVRWRARSTARSRASSSRPTCCRRDITGVNVFNQRTSEFEFRPGPVFANIVLADEINRASPKTQSALLECMQERQVTVDGVTHPLAAPFIVIATQNPIEQEGTFPLPEAQLDRFTLRLALGYPEPGAEARMLADQTAAEGSPLESLAPVADAARGRRGGARLPRVHVAPALHATSSRSAARRASDARLALGASPRAGVTLLRAGAGACARARPRPRAARRRQGAGARRARPPPAAGRRARRRMSHRSSTSCSRGCPCRCERRRGPRCADRTRARCARLRPGRDGLRAAVRDRRCRAARSGARRRGADRARLGRARGRAACRGAHACPPSRTRASSCASRSSCARWRARIRGRAAFIETEVGRACALRPVTTGGLRVLRGSYELGPLTRGLRELGAGLLVREDPFGLARRADATRGSTALTCSRRRSCSRTGRSAAAARSRSRATGCAAAGTSCTACASTSPANRCGACTGRRPPTTGA